MRALFRRQKQANLGAEWLVVGLGNPGPEHARDRHNVGAWTVAELARRHGINVKTAGNAVQAGVGRLAGTPVALARTRTYMNNSGKAVRQAQQLTGCDSEHTIVVYDELDLPSGALRLRAGGGTGGHNGLRSIVGVTAPDFVRVRIGIGRPFDGDKPSWDPQIVADHVLNPPSSSEERTLLEETARIAADAVEAVIADGVAAAANHFNRT